MSGSYSPVNYVSFAFRNPDMKIISDLLEHFYAATNTQTDLIATTEF